MNLSDNLSDNEVKRIRLTTIFNLMKEDRITTLPNYFNKLEIQINKNVFPPDYGEGTELLLNYIISNENELKNKEVLDLGTGSGVIGILAAKKGAKVLSLDFSQASFNCAIDNANSLLSQGERQRIRIEKSNLFSFFDKQDEHSKFDYIFFNPPFIDTSWHIKALADSDKKPESDFIRSIFDPQGDTLMNFLIRARDFLSDNGKIVIAYSMHEPLTRVSNIINNAGFKIKFIKGLSNEILKGQKKLLFYSVELIKEKDNDGSENFKLLQNLKSIHEKENNTESYSELKEKYNPSDKSFENFENFMQAFNKRIALAKDYIKIYSLFPIPGMFIDNSNFEDVLINKLKNSDIKIIHAFVNDSMLTKNLIHFSNNNDKEYLLRQLLKIRDFRENLSIFDNQYFPFRIENVPFFIVLIDKEFAMMGYINMLSNNPYSWLNSGFETIDHEQVTTIEGIFDNFVLNLKKDDYSEYLDIFDPSYIKDFKNLRNFDFEQEILDNELGLDKKKMFKKSK